MKLDWYGQVVNRNAACNSLAIWSIFLRAYRAKSVLILFRRGQGWVRPSPRVEYLLGRGGPPLEPKETFFPSMLRRRSCFFITIFRFLKKHAKAKFLGQFFVTIKKKVGASCLVFSHLPASPQQGGPEHPPPPLKKPARAAPGRRTSASYWRRSAGSRTPGCGGPPCSTTSPASSPAPAAAGLRGSGRLSPLALTPPHHPEDLALRRIEQRIPSPETLSRNLSPVRLPPEWLFLQEHLNGRRHINTQHW